jgi:hypothetical protein
MDRGIGRVPTSVSIDSGVDLLLAHVAGVSARWPVGFHTLVLDDMEKAHAEMGNAAHIDVAGHALGHDLGRVLGHAEVRVCHVNAGDRRGQGGGADVRDETQ